MATRSALPFPSRGRAASERGLTLVDALVATAILATVAAGAGSLLTWSARAIWTSSTQSTAMWLAEQKLEQLCALEWSVDAEGVDLSDQTTNAGTDPMRDDGPGLSPSPASAIDENTGGYMDFVGHDGVWRGDAAPQNGAAFVRRWSIVPLPSDPRNTLVVTVSVRPLSEAARDASPVSSGATLQTVRTRLLR